jgi:alpha-glucosidase
MIADLHKMGFKVMLWVSPFVSPDSEIGREVVKKHLVLLNKDNKPFICHWWNGYSLLLDFSNPDAVKWFKNSLNILLTRYGVDGFKFDGGDTQEYSGDIIPFKNGITANTETELYAKIGLDYPFNEYRANWKMGGEALTNRLADKGHNWQDLQTLIPDMILEGLMGYPYSCPDMIGGGEFTSFLDSKTIDQNLIVRSAQCSALMPMMQFSVAPWRILDRVHFDAVLKAVKLREKFVGYILRTVKHTAVTGDPILRNMEYEFPHCGYDKIKDQFLIGDSLLVAPILQNNISKREIILPKGKWKYETGSVYEGPKIIEVDAGLDVLPYFIKLK